MKYLLILLFASFYARAFAGRGGGSRVVVMNMIVECKQENPLAENETEAYVANHTVPNSETGKKFLTCVLKKAKFYPDDQFNKTSAMEDVEEVFKNEGERYLLARYAVDTCAAVVGPNEDGNIDNHAYAVAICGATFIKLYRFQL